MRYLLIGLPAAILLSCNPSVTEKKLKGCDSLVITFNMPGSDSVIRTVHTTDTRAIQKMARFLDGRSTEQYKCGYDGNMLFFKAGNQVMPVVFRYTDKDCRHFVYDLDNKVVSTAMDPEAADFLESLSAGRNSY